jgi:hypothetical protein
LIPNQEWFQKAWVPELFRFQEIWAKTEYAAIIFNGIVKDQKRNNPERDYPTVK